MNGFNIYLRRTIPLCYCTPGSTGDDVSLAARAAPLSTVCSSSLEAREGTKPAASRSLVPQRVRYMLSSPARRFTCNLCVRNVSGFNLCFLVRMFKLCTKSDTF